MACRLGLLALLLLAGSVSAQDLPPPSPVDLARGLRENGMADLALEYLDELAAKATPDVLKVLPLERAKCRLELAATESDDTLRTALVAEAKREFDAFVKANAGHPRLPEAAVALARLQTLEGKSMVQRANRLPDAQRAGELAKARPQFVSAGKQFATVSDAIKKQADQEDPNTLRHKELTQQYLQAVLDQGANLYLLSDSYPEDVKGADFEAKQKAAKDANLVFDSVWNRYKDFPQGWEARAWAAECLRLQFEPVKANTGLKALIDDATKTKTTATAAGMRMARFFTLREDFDKNGGQAASPADRLRVRNACRDWLKDYAGAGRPAPEVYAVRYYLGRVCVNEAMKRENLTVEATKEKGPDGKPIEKVVGVKDPGLTLLREAETQFRQLVRTENEYSERAARQRPAALRWLVGNLDRPPAQFFTFDDSYMAALVHLEEARAAATAPERGAQLEKGIALLERANALPIPPESAKDAARADMDLARAYIAVGRPYSAAVFAEHLARSARSSTAAARAAVIALDAYSRTARTTDPNFEDGRTVDRDRRISLAQFMEKVAPNEPETDGARLQLGADLYRIGRKAEAFDAFSRVPNRFPRVSQARLFEGIAAFDLVRPLGPDETRTDDLPADKKAAVFQRAVADLSAVSLPADGTRDDPASDLAPVSDYFNMRLQLAQLHVTQGAKGYPLAEQAVVTSAAAAAKHPGLSADDKTKFAMRFEAMHIRTVFGQAMPLYQQGKYAEAAERLGGLLAQVLKAGPAVKASQPADIADLARALDADRIRLLLVPCLNARVREGAVAKTTELLDELKKFGGDLSTSARVVQQGVASIRPTVELLRKEKKDDEADKLVKAVSSMVTKLAAEPNLPMDVRLNLGRSFRELGEYAKAVDLLNAVPAPQNKESLKGELKGADAETPDQMKQREADNAAAPQYRLARLELARCYRLEKKFAEAGAVLDDALGKEGEPKANSKVKPRAGGWASRFPDFRKEAILLIEARAAAATDAKVAAPLWNEAIGNWAGWAAQYLAEVNQLNQKHSPAKQKAERLTFRLRLIDELSGREQIDYEAEKARAVKELGQAEKDETKATGEVSAAVKAFEAATTPADVEKAREKLEAARDTAEDAARKVAELKARPPVLDEFAKKKKVDWAEETKVAQKELDALQKEMGELDRRMNPLRSVWQDVLAEQFRCLLAAQTAILKPAKPADFDGWVVKHAKSVADFEKGNRPLPVNVKQKLYDMLESNTALRDEYRKAGGTDLIAPPSGTP